MQQTLCDETFAFLQDPNDTETFRNFCKIVIMQLGVCSRQKGFPPEMHPVSSSGLQQPTDSEGDSQARGIQLLRSLPRTLYDPRNYGPKPGSETLEEARLREAREKAERERKLREIDEMRAKQANGGGDDFSLPGCMKIAELVEINTSICL